MTEALELQTPEDRIVPGLRLLDLTEGQERELVVMRVGDALGGARRLEVLNRNGELINMGTGTLTHLLRTADYVEDGRPRIGDTEPGAAYVIMHSWLIDAVARPMTGGASGHVILYTRKDAEEAITTLVDKTTDAHGFELRRVF